MTDVELSMRFGVPTRTLSDWKKQKPSNWRKKMYLFLQETLIKEKQEAREKEVSRTEE